ncbi:MAG TPA: histidinol dehydrogenase [Woeseiaceae bacterium]|nr:histidinol dehydrogenase [Woeseiaceae bacterium]
MTDLPIHDWSALAARARHALLARPAAGGMQRLRADVRAILADVRQNGDRALRELSRRHDRVDLAEFEVSRAEKQAAQTILPDVAVAAIDLAIANVRLFHEAQVPAPFSIETMPGVQCERVSRPIDAVGLYVPAGSAPLPSAAVMLAVPARIAGCPLRILCTPPRPDGFADPAVVVAATRAGVERIFKIGGAQAIAAMAYGTETVPKVAKIFGPGNPWVTCAKSLVASDPDGAAIDMPAGPSEVLVIADGGANADFVAADLLSQAEHGPDSQVLLITTNAAFAGRVRDALERQLCQLGRRDVAESALRNSRLILVDSLDTAVRISNDYAPEHLILQCDNARDLLPTVRNAGSVFVGAWTPEAVGDYCSGTNHVLPTYGYARSYGGLGVDQFLRHMTVQELTRDGLRRIGPAVMTLAGLEGLDAHAAAVRLRLEAGV